MPWPTPWAGPDGAEITNTAPRSATTPATACGSHDQRSTTAVLAGSRRTRAPLREGTGLAREPCGQAVLRGGRVDTERGQPVLDDLDVDALEAVDVAAIGGVAVAGHGDQVTRGVERRATGVAEAAAAAPAGVVLVAVDLQDLRGQLLAHGVGVPALDRVALQRGLLRARGRLAHLGAVAHHGEQGRVQGRLAVLVELVERGELRRLDAGDGLVEDHDADV